MSSKQRTFGQFETPVDVADLLLGFCLRRASDRLLDPSCGQGALLNRANHWRNWLADRPADITADGLWGVELDPDTAETARKNLPVAHILTQNFFTLQPDSAPHFDAIIGNPPYTRAEWFGRLGREAGQQLLLDLPQEGIGSAGLDKLPLVPRDLWLQLDKRAGLHAYFLLHSAFFLREGGRLGFVVPNGWLDVAYGQKLKSFLLEHFRILAIIESWVERWFLDAKVNTCLVVLEKCADPTRRTANLVRLVRLRRTLNELIPAASDDRERPAVIESLVSRLLPAADRQSPDLGVRVLPQRELDAGARWGLALRAPAVYRDFKARKAAPSLRSWARVKRGFTTGANAFFYLSEKTIERWSIEPEFRRPVLKSMRSIDRLSLSAGSCRHELFHVPPDANVRGTAASRYIKWGEEQGYHLRRTCAGRRPWYSLPGQQPADLALAKGTWRRHFALLLKDSLAIDQQLYGVYLEPEVPSLAAAALLNSAWFALQCELQGRINFGEGVLWLATYETGSIMLPDPRRLPPSQVRQLEDLFAQMARRPVQDIAVELSRPDRRALDSAVFDVLELSAAERDSVLDALLERVEIRTRRAGSGAQPL